MRVPSPRRERRSTGRSLSSSSDSSDSSDEEQPPASRGGSGRDTERSMERTRRTAPPSQQRALSLRESDAERGGSGRERERGVSGRRGYESRDAGRSTRSALSSSSDSSDSSDEELPSASRGGSGRDAERSMQRTLRTAPLSQRRARPLRESDAERGVYGRRAYESRDAGRSTRSALSSLSDSSDEELPSASRGGSGRYAERGVSGRRAYESRDAADAGRSTWGRGSRPWRRSGRDPERQDDEGFQPIGGNKLRLPDGTVVTYFKVFDLAAYAHDMRMFSATLKRVDLLSIRDMRTSEAIFQSSDLLGGQLLETDDSVIARYGPLITMKCPRNHDEIKSLLGIHLSSKKSGILSDHTFLIPSEVSRETGERRRHLNLPFVGPGGTPYRLDPEHVTDAEEITRQLRHGTDSRPEHVRAAKLGPITDRFGNVRYTQAELTQKREDIFSLDDKLSYTGVDTQSAISMFNGVFCLKSVTKIPINGVGTEKYKALVYKKVGYKSLGKDGVLEMKERTEGEIFFLTCDESGIISGGSLPDCTVCAADRNESCELFVYNSKVKFEIKGRLIWRPKISRSSGYDEMEGELPYRDRKEERGIFQVTLEQRFVDPTPGQYDKQNMANFTHTLTFDMNNDLIGVFTGFIENSSRGNLHSFMQHFCVAQKITELDGTEFDGDSFKQDAIIKQIEAGIDPETYVRKVKENFIRKDQESGLWFLKMVLSSPPPFAENWEINSIAEAAKQNIENFRRRHNGHAVAFETSKGGPGGRTKITGRTYLEVDDFTVNYGLGRMFQEIVDRLLMDKRQRERRGGDHQDFK